MLSLILALCSCAKASSECVEPPPLNVGDDSGFRLSLDPNPVEAGSNANVTVEGTGPSNSGIVGLGMSWECWNGDRWVETHTIVRGFNSTPPALVDHSTGVTMAIPDLGLSVPNTAAIVIPAVGAGTYRITDRIQNQGTPVSTHEYVKVIGP